ncbi:hypothetical protein ACFYP4_16505 [Streptomyces sp. NPDC005551]|uniref:hypothetical protein n=1 Tax=unclassified Streptomyces TaxID=2593676 RepID=UPI0033D29456
MSPTKLPPAALQRWAEQQVGPVPDASHDWDRSRVWDLEGERGVHHYLKVSPSVKFFTRESRAYRHIVPVLGHTRAPRLIDSRAQDLALLLTAVPGTPAKKLSQRSLRQILCEPRFEGRMQAASTTVTAGARPHAAAATCALVLFLGVGGTLTVGAVLQIVPVILLFASPVRALRDMPVPSAGTAVPPACEGAS